MHTFNSDHHISTHEVHEAIRSLGLDSHAQAYFMGQVDAHNHDGVLSGEGLNRVMHQLSNTSGHGIHHESLDKFSQALQQHPPGHEGH